MYRASTVVLILVSLAVAFVIATVSFGQQTQVQPQQFRFQQPPALDIRPDYNSYEGTKPCQN